MLALRVNGSHPINRLRREMDRLFEGSFEGFPRLTRDMWSASAFPAVNVWEDADHIYIEAELPGFRLEDLELLVMGDELTIKGERKDVVDDNVTYHRRERSTDSFSRVWRLPVEVDAVGVEATLRDGVLTVTLPKGEQAKPRKIEVKAVPE